MKLNLIQVYAPTSDSSVEEIEKFYDDLDDLTRKLKKHEVTIIMGDLNVKVGKGQDEDTVGRFGLGDRNERGDRLVQYCQEKEMIIRNTFYDLPPRRLYTWTAPGHTKNNIIRNQIDFIIINKRFRNGIQSVKTYPSADADSDHNLLLSHHTKTNKKKTET